MNNLKTKEKFLMHWNLLEGAKAKVHKYIAREDTGKTNKKGNNVYRYFYTQKAYDAFKQKINNAATAIKDSSFGKSWSSGIKTLQNAGKDYVDMYLAGLGKKSYFKSKEVEIENAKKRLKVLPRVYTDPITNIDSAAKASADRQRGTREPTYTTNGITVYENTGSGKWIAKIKTPSGRIRYFYDEKQYNRWKEVQKYQENEPEFMKKYREIDPTPEGKMPSQNDDYTLVNDRHLDQTHSGKYFRVPRTTNCIYCSATYELRRRGYDVEAAAISSHHGNEFYNEVYKSKDGKPIIDITEKYIHTGTGKGFEISDQYKKDYMHDVELVDKNGKLQTLTVTVEVPKQNSHVVSVIPTDDDYKSYARWYSDMMDSYWTEEGPLGYDTNWSRGVDVNKLYSAVDSNFPDKSRGSISCYWTNGGGHSFVWEKTDNGEIKFYDSQLNVEYSKSAMEQISKSINTMSAVTFIRTDDLELTEEMKHYITPRRKRRSNNIFDYTVDDPTEWYESKRLDGKSNKINDLEELK